MAYGALFFQIDMFIAGSFYRNVYTHTWYSERVQYTVCPRGLNSWHGVLAIFTCNYKRICAGAFRAGRNYNNIEKEKTPPGAVRILYAVQLEYLHATFLQTNRNSIVFSIYTVCLIALG